MGKMGKCPMCGNELSNKRYKIEDDIATKKCEPCGEYKISLMAERTLQYSPEYEKDKYILSALSREATENGREIVFTTENIQDYIDSAPIPDGPLEAIDRIILYVYRKSETAGSYISLKPEDYPIAYAKNMDEFDFYKKKATEIGYLERDTTKDGSIDYRLTLKGWERVDELRKKTPESRQAFVAMRFSDEMKKVYKEAIEPAISDTGYKPMNLAFLEHNEKIDDKIIAEIRKSGLLVADLTENNQGVYFEAGLAMGLGIPVIWTCRKDNFESIHFDTRQYNYIVWENPDELKEKLINRIEATNPIRNK